MKRPTSRTSRLRDYVLTVFGSASASLALLLLTLSISMGPDHLLDQLLAQRGWPSTLVLAIVGFAIAVGCGVIYALARTDDGRG